MVVNKLNELWRHLVTERWLLRGCGGDWILWPENWNRGALNSSDLRALAAKMDRLNKQNKERIEKAFEALNEKQGK